MCMISKLSGYNNFTVSQANKVPFGSGQSTPIVKNSESGDDKKYNRKFGTLSLLLLATGLGLLLGAKIYERKNYNKLLESLGDKAKQKLKDELAKYHSSHRHTFVFNLNKNDKIAQSSPEKIEELVSQIAKDKKIKLKSEETFFDKAERCIDYLLYF